MIVRLVMVLFEIFRANGPFASTPLWALERVPI